MREGSARKLSASSATISRADSANHAPLAAGSGTLASGAKKIANAGRYLNWKWPSDSRYSGSAASARDPAVQ